MDFITIKNLKIFANHGVYAFETEKGQNFYVNLKLYLDLKEAGASDDLSKSVNYGEVCLFLEHFLTEHTFQLLETAAYEAAKALLLEFPLIHSIDFELCKPEAPIPFDFENVSVSMQMGWHKVYIALGSNIGKRQGYIEEALYKIDKEEEFRNLRYSTLIETKPYGYVEQENFINGVLEAETFLKPEQLLHKLQEYEAAAHRERKIHWGPRTLDLDILFYDNLVLDSEQLVIPHPDMMNRTFVLEPLNELVPYLRHPINGMTVAEMYMALKGKE